VHEDLAQLDALAALPQRSLHGLTAADDGHTTDAPREVNAHVAVPCRRDSTHTCTALAVATADYSHAVAWNVWLLIKSRRHVFSL
jgi:hypothetical protein